MLLLRKSCQEILDANGFSMLHVEIQNKYMCIVGECGKNVVSISGISFASTRINSDERAYATQLFAKFITKYVDKIKALINAKKALIDFKDKMTYLGDICKVESNVFYENGKASRKEFTVVFNTRHKAKICIKKDSIKINDYLSFKDFNFIVSEIEEDCRFAINVIQELEECEKLEEAVREVEKDIQSCNI